MDTTTWLVILSNVAVTLATLATVLVTIKDDHRTVLDLFRIAMGKPTSDERRKMRNESRTPSSIYDIWS